MTTVLEARAAMLAVIEPLGAESVILGEAFGRTLAASVSATRDQPPFTASAMDGYALRAGDTPGNLQLAGESAAGRALGAKLDPGQAVRISTGAPMPDGADAVLIQEDALIRGDCVVAPEVPGGRHVRRHGIDFKRGQVMLQAGVVLDATSIALAAACGASAVQVAKRPRVAIMSGGDEIVSPGANPREDQIFDSCSYGIEALARAWGAEARRSPLLPDKLEAIELAAARALAESDLVVFIGSASVGPHDHARPAFERLGARLLVSKVDMRPGKPTWFASAHTTPVLGLPGNPASAFVSSALFLAPLLAKLQGRDATPVVRHGRLSHALPPNGPRDSYLRARVWTDEFGQTVIDASDDQDSSLLSVFARCNALLIRTAGAEPAPAQSCADYIAWPDIC